MIPALRWIFLHVLYALALHYAAQEWIFSLLSAKQVGIIREELFLKPENGFSKHCGFSSNSLIMIWLWSLIGHIPILTGWNGFKMISFPLQLSRGDGVWGGCLLDQTHFHNGIRMSNAANEEQGEKQNSREKSLWRIPAHMEISSHCLFCLRPERETQLSINQNSFYD